ncbi:hypothetical protein P8452_23868 [Trifolium repens]|nr:hypothetical protein P8452_23868 [Trifolium repens]
MVWLCCWWWRGRHTADGEVMLWSRCVGGGGWRLWRRWCLGAGSGGGCWWHAPVWCRRSWCVGDGSVALFSCAADLVFTFAYFWQW